MGSWTGSQQISDSHDDICRWTKTNAERLIREILGWSDAWYPKYIEGKISEILERKIGLLSKIKEPKSISGDALFTLDTLIANAPDSDSSHSLRLDESESEIEEDLHRLSEIDNPPVKKLIVEASREKSIHFDPRRRQDPSAYFDVYASVNWNQLHIKEDKSLLKRYCWADFVGAETGREFIFEIKPVVYRSELFQQLSRYRSIWRAAKIVVVSPDVRFVDEILDEGYGFIPFPHGDISLPEKF